jgi:hypothetical protein
LIDQINVHRDLAWPPSRIEMQHEARADSIRENLQLALDLARESVDEADAQAAGRSPQIELGRQASPPVRNLQPELVGARLRQRYANLARSGISFRSTSFRLARSPG